MTTDFQMPVHRARARWVIALGALLALLADRMVAADTGHGMPDVGSPAITLAGAAAPSLLVRPAVLPFIGIHAPRPGGGETGGLQRPGRATVAAPADDLSLCDQAAGLAVAESPVPPDLLMAIGRAESGRTVHGRFMPWPWTVNVNGAGRYFATRAEAIAHAEAALATGVRNVDIGCFQINHHWHGAAFASVDEMFDPLANARYAVRFLVALRAETGSWERATGAYHSRTPGLRDRYSQRVAHLRDRLAAVSPPARAAGDPDGGTPPPGDGAPPPRISSLSLLTTRTASPGPLIPDRSIPHAGSETMPTAGSLAHRLVSETGPDTPARTTGGTQAVGGIRHAPGRGEAP